MIKEQIETIKNLPVNYTEIVQQGISDFRDKPWLQKPNSIAWTEDTWNMTWGCSKVSEGCRNCYASDLVKRWGFGSTKPHLWGKDGESGSGKGWQVENGRRIFAESYWRKLRNWNQTAKENNSIMVVFVGNMNDSFEDHPVTKSELVKLWKIIRETPYVHYQFLTKRPERIRRSLPSDWWDYENGYPNVWLGVSIESQNVAYRFDRYLADIPASVKFVSYEPALGPLKALRWDKLDWVIVGGESGHNHRPFDHQWAEDVRDLSARHSVQFFYKQDSARFTNRGQKLNGVKYYNYPIPRHSLHKSTGLNSIVKEDQLEFVKHLREEFDKQSWITWNPESRKLEPNPKLKTTLLEIWPLDIETALSILDPSCGIWCWNWCTALGVALEDCLECKHSKGEEVYWNEYWEKHPELKEENVTKAIDVLGELDESIREELDHIEFFELDSRSRRHLVKLMATILEEKYEEDQRSNGWLDSELLRLLRKANLPESFLLDDQKKSA
ncbi:phage Gp37/Gp68 family protein [Verrucomicrobia bacterium]|nr:phage Gp37/Gp68 family protein [Verrucomicrobiota bacterium]